MKVIILRMAIATFAGGEDLVASLDGAVIHLFRVDFLVMFFQHEVVPEALFADVALDGSIWVWFR